MTKHTHVMLIKANWFRDDAVLFMLYGLRDDHNYQIDWSVEKKSLAKSVFRVTGTRDALSMAYRLCANLNSAYHWYGFCHTSGVERIDNKPIVEHDGISVGGLRSVVLMTQMGHRCGYVGVPEDHPLFGAHYNVPHPALASLPESEPVGKRSPMQLITMTQDKMNSPSPESAFDVHGGITFSGGGDFPVPQWPLARRWWFGFDAAHCDDAPASGSEMDTLCPSLYQHGQIHRTKEYMINECDRLAEQMVGPKVRQTTAWQRLVYQLTVVAKGFDRWKTRWQMRLEYSPWIKARPRLQRFVRGY